MRDERFEIELRATPEEVWRSLTTSEGLASWFGTRAEVEARVHGERVVGWGDDAEIRGRITDLEPLERLRVVYLADGEEVGAEEWLITTDGTTTRLILINSMADEGIDDWEGFYGDMRRGWRLFLASLRHGLDDAITPYRHVEHTMVPAPGPRRPIRERLERCLANHEALVSAMTTTLSDPPHSLLLTARDRTLLLDIEGADDDQVLYVQAATHDGPARWPTEVVEAIRSTLGERDSSVAEGRSQ